MATVKGAWGEDIEVPDTIDETPEVAQTPEIVSEVTDTVTPTVVPETVETPAAIESPVIEDAPAEVETTIETPTPEPTQAEVEVAVREVEKIVEKYPEMDEYTGAIFQAILDGKEDVLLNYLTEKNRDYNTMSDYDVVKAQLKAEKPNWSDDDIELKIERKYGDVHKIDVSKLDEDSTEYEEAVAHNKQVDINQKDMRLDAIEAREDLNAQKKEIKLPKIETPQVEVPVQETPEEVAQRQAQWISRVESEIPNVKEFTFKVGDKETGYEDVAFQITDADRKEQAEFLKNVDMHKMVARLGWVDESGNQNIQKMAGDVLKLEKLQQIISSAYTKGKTTGTKGTIEEIKNLDLTGKAQTSVAAAPPDIGTLLWGDLNPK